MSKRTLKQGISRQIADIDACRLEINQGAKRVRQAAAEPKVLYPLLTTGLLSGFLIGYLLPRRKSSLAGTIIKNKGEEKTPGYKLQELLASPLSLLVIDLLRK